MTRHDRVIAGGSPRLLQIVFHLRAPDLRLLLHHLGMICFSKDDVQPAHRGKKIDSRLDVVYAHGGKLVFLTVAVGRLLEELLADAEVGKARSSSPRSGGPSRQ